MRWLLKSNGQLNYTNDDRLHYNTSHYNDVLSRVARVENTLWIGTADIKFACAGRSVVRAISCRFRYFSATGSEGTVIYAKEPGPNFRKDFDRYPALWSGLKRKLCPRAHFKMMIFDSSVAYIGSANLMSAGIGMKSDGKRNFEAGILTDDLGLVDAAADHFDSVWTGVHCKSCRRKDFCQDRIR